MYNNISKQISIAQEERQQVLILGDFNAKVGTHIGGNKPTNSNKREETIDENEKKKIRFGKNKQRKRNM